MKLVLATANKSKIVEFRDAFAGLSIDLLSTFDFDIAEMPEETGSSYEENSLIKANFITQLTGLNALADDSGLELTALNNEPGIFSARYGGLSDSSLRNEYLLEKLKDKSDRTAKFVTSLVFTQPNLPHKAFAGEVHGEIIHDPKGQAGFGYDPIFYSFELKKTFAQATKAEKRLVSHRGKAITKFLEYLKSL